MCHHLRALRSITLLQIFPILISTCKKKRRASSHCCSACVCDTPTVPFVQSLDDESREKKVVSVPMNTTCDICYTCHVCYVWVRNKVPWRRNRCLQSGKKYELMCDGWRSKRTVSHRGLNVPWALWPMYTVSSITSIYTPHRRSQHTADILIQQVIIYVRIQLQIHERAYWSNADKTTAHC